jgi:hypothetical protein
MTFSLSFPFVRDVIYPTAAIRDFQKALGRGYSEDPDLSIKTRGRKFPWAKLWDEELLPIFLFASQQQLPADAKFRIMPEGHAVDVEIQTSGETTRFQITTAYPDWNEAATGGYTRHLEREGLNQGTAVFGGGRILKNPNGQVASSPRGRLSPAIACQAWKSGLMKAINDKLAKSETYYGIVDILLVFADRLLFDIFPVKTTHLVLPLIAEAVRGLETPLFKKIVVLDCDPLAYVCVEIPRDTPIEI